jgi:hypothetical protein
MTRYLKFIPNDQVKEFRSVFRQLFKKPFLEKDRLDMLKLIQKLLQLTPRAKKTQFHEGLQKEALQNIDRFKSCCLVLKNFFSTTSTCFLDIFFITRMLSTNQPALSIGYFGDYHTQKIVHFLVNRLEYTVAYKSPDLPNVGATLMVRCIEMPDIDLDSTLRDLLTDQRKEKAIRHILALNAEREQRLSSLRGGSLFNRMIAI